MFGALVSETEVALRILPWRWTPVWKKSIKRVKE